MSIQNFPGIGEDLDGSSEISQFRSMLAAYGSSSNVLAKNFAQILAVTVVTTGPELEALKEDWSRLFEATPHASGSQSWTYAVGAWRHVHAQGWRLHVVVVRLGDRLVAVWPLAIRRSAALRIASHLGRGSDEEYAGPLIAPGPQAREAARSALSGARQGVDLLKVFNVHPDNPVRPHLDRLRVGNRAATPVHIALTSAHRDIDGWLSSRSRKFRKNLTRSRHQLDALGEVGIRCIEDPAVIPSFVEWLFAHKLSQLDSLDIKRSWLRAPASRRLFEEILRAGDKPGCACAFELTVSGQRIAAAVALEGARLELAVTTYDPAFADASPGVALHAFAARTAVERGLDLDFRFGDETFKAWWTDEVETRWNYTVASTPIGSAGVAAVWMRGAVRAVRRRVGPSIKRLLSR